MEWYYRSGDRQVGPVTDEDMRKHLVSGRIGVATPVWHEGWPDWQRAGDTELAQASSPPSARVAKQQPLPSPSPQSTIADVASRAEWYFRSGERQVGPITDAGMRNMLASGGIGAETPVWREGLTGWRRAGDTELAALTEAYKESASVTPKHTSVTPSHALPQRSPVPPFITADDIRVTGEKLALRLCLAFVGSVPFALFLVYLNDTDGITFWGVVEALLVAVGSVGLAMFGAALRSRIHQNILLGSCVKVTSAQFADVYNLFREGADRLCVKQPDLYIQQGDELNAYAIGPFGKKAVVATSRLVATMTSAELQFVLGHELTHIKCRHTFWLGVIGNDQEGSASIPFLSTILGMCFLHWSRKAEYTCDRGGHMACTDSNAAVCAIAKLLVGPELFPALQMDQIAKQLKEIDDDLSVQWCEWGFADHPFILNRIQALGRYASPSNQ